MSLDLREEDDETISSHSSAESSDEEDKDFPIIMILMKGLWACLFAVFSFGFDMDPDSCVVSNKDDLFSERIP